MKCIDELSPSELLGKRVLVRAGLDVPLSESGDVADSFRLQRAAKTLLYLSTVGARVVVISHIGRAGDSLAPVAEAMQRFVQMTFVPDVVGRYAHDAVHAMKEGEILLLENLRRDAREEANDEGFARALAELGEIYVDDAFSNAHRAHASMVGVAKYLPHYAGFLVQDEVRALTAARTPNTPSLAIIGGAKFETKEPLIEALLDTYDTVFVCGALANDILKARGLPVGRSVISNAPPQAHIVSHPRLLVSSDVMVERPDGQAFAKSAQEVLPDERIVDFGPDTFAELAPVIAKAKSVLWNGPSGVYEEGYVSWTHAIAEAIAESGTHSVIGGNNTIAAIHSSGVAEDRFTFLSTGGGAMVEFLLKGTLPAIEALA